MHKRRMLAKDIGEGECDDMSDKTVASPTYRALGDQ